MNRVYWFSPTVRVQLESYRAYLQQEQHGLDYIRQNSNYAGVFLEWLAAESLALTQVSHSEILDFADHLKQRGHTVNHINGHLRAIRYYFAYLQSKALPPAGGEGLAGAYNPAAAIRLKGRVRTVPHDLLEKAELEAIYYNYEVKDDRSHRNKVMLSLLVFQGISNEELHKLKAVHVKLKEGNIHIPAGNQTGGRVLKLEAGQVMELYEYITITRPKILAGRESGQWGKKPKEMKEAANIEQLFISMNGCENIKNSLYHLNEAIRKFNPKYRNAKQIRQSVITEWLKEKDVRTVQYMAGHRYVSSTERYQSSNLEDLKEALSKHHPLR